MASKVQSIIATGTKGTIVDIECHLSNNLPNIVIVGFANKAVDESRERIRGSFATSRIMLPRKRITINLAPADVPKADSSFDLAIAVAILRASGQITTSLDRNQAFIGELGLDGSTRAVRGIIGKLLLGRAKGITRFFIPHENLQQALLVPKITIIPIRSLGELYAHLCLGTEIRTLDTGPDGRQIAKSPSVAGTYIGLSEVVGQFQAKRALIIAAAGGHNILFDGPPGTGKSMLAKAVPSVLPQLTREEMLEVTHLHSLASQDYEQIIVERPFRSPHHTASHVAVVGGGTKLRPGEISLAHRGVLFFDELPEFDRETLEALRQPLEDRVINVARVKDSAQYPANFIFLATANPCPCGYYKSDKSCACTSSERNRYRNKLSGPILDRIDLHCSVHEIEHNKLLATPADQADDETVKSQISAARDFQTARFGTSSMLNTDMNNQEVRTLAQLELSAKQVLNQSARQYKFSARGYMRTVKVARTIADLAGSPTITSDHIAEAVVFRPQKFKDNKP